VFVVCDTTLELESRALIDPVICWCKKHRQLARQKGGFVACFPLNISMVHSPKPIVIANDNNLTDVGLALGETIRFECL
jgi:hypothetical protein